MAQRTGIFKTQSLAKQLCRAVTLADPAIRKVYGSNATLIAALEAANAACALLADEVEAVREFGD